MLQPRSAFGWNAIVSPALLLFVAGWVPLWRCWSVSDWCAFGGHCSLWSAIAVMAKGDSEIDICSWIFLWHWENWVQVSVTLVAGVFGGWLIGKLLRSPAAASAH